MTDEQPKPKKAKGAANITTKLSETASGQVEDVLDLLKAGEYSKARYTYITHNEAAVPTAYMDNAKVPKKTVGIGFNMDASTAKAEWKQAFGDGKEAPSFDDVYAGKRKLSDDEMRLLYDVSAKTRETELFGKDGKHGIYGGIADKLEPQQRLVIEDLYYNMPNAVRKDKPFYTHMHDYAKAVDAKDEKAAAASLDAAKLDILQSTNPQLNNGVSNRRLAQAALFSGDTAIVQPDKVQANLVEKFSNLLKDNKIGKVTLDGSKVTCDTACVINAHDGKKLVSDFLKEKRGEPTKNDVSPADTLTPIGPKTPDKSIQGRV